MVASRAAAAAHDKLSALTSSFHPVPRLTALRLLTRKKKVLLFLTGSRGTLQCNSMVTSPLTDLLKAVLHFTFPSPPTSVSKRTVRKPEHTPLLPPTSIKLALNPDLVARDRGYKQMFLLMMMFSCIVQSVVNGSLAPVQHSLHPQLTLPLETAGDVPVSSRLAVDRGRGCGDACKPGRYGCWCTTAVLA